MSDLAGDIIDLEVVDPFGPTLARKNIGPGGFNSATKGRDEAQPGYDDATEFHIDACPAA
jgi:hypothetical protein